MNKSYRGKTADFVVRGHDALGSPISEVLRDAYIGPEFYFWLGADAYPDWPVVTSIAFSRVKLTCG